MRIEWARWVGALAEARRRRRGAPERSEHHDSPFHRASMLSNEVNCRPGIFTIQPPWLTTRLIPRSSNVTIPYMWDCAGACSAHAPRCAGACSKVRRRMLRGAPAHAPSLRRRMFRACAGACPEQAWHRLGTDEALRCSKPVPAHAPRCAGACSGLRRRMLRGAPEHAPRCAGACSKLAPAHVPRAMHFVPMDAPRFFATIFQFRLDGGDDLTPHQRLTKKALKYSGKRLRGSRWNIVGA